MANKKISTSENPLIRRNFLITQCECDFLDTLENESASSFIRKLIDAQMSGHEVEISKLREERKQHVAHINFIDAQIVEYEVEDQQKQIAGHTREQLLTKYIDRLLRANEFIDFKDRQFKRMFQNNLEDANKVLNGNGEPIKEEELQELIITKAKAIGKYIL